MLRQVIRRLITQEIRISFTHGFARTTRNACWSGPVPPDPSTVDLNSRGFGAGIGSLARTCTTQELLAGAKVALETIAAARPLIATAVGGIPEIFAAEAGRLIAPSPERGVR